MTNGKINHALDRQQKFLFILLLKTILFLILYLQQVGSGDVKANKNCYRKFRQARNYDKLKNVKNPQIWFEKNPCLIWSIIFDLSYER